MSRFDVQHESSPNHDYVLSRALQYAGTENARFLDFGCGTGALIGKARAQGLNFWGADKYGEWYKHWEEGLPESLRPYIGRIADGTLPYPDQHFDLVVSNQVFEHMTLTDLEKSFTEIRRVLNPGGIFLALFPTRDVWFEGHLGLYFPHHLDRWPALQKNYLHLCHILGFGYHRHDYSSQAWAGGQQHVLRTDVFYHRLRAVEEVWKAVFNSAPKSLAEDYILFRLKQHPSLKRVAPIVELSAASPLLRLICHKRAGRIFLGSRN